MSEPIPAPQKALLKLSRTDPKVPAIVPTLPAPCPGRSYLLYAALLVSQRRNDVFGEQLHAAPGGFEGNAGEAEAGVQVEIADDFAARFPTTSVESFPRTARVVTRVGPTTKSLRTAGPRNDPDAVFVREVEIIETLVNAGKAADALEELIKLTKALFQA